MPDQIAAGRANEESKMRAPFRRPSLRSLVVPLCVVLVFFATASWYSSIDWNGPRNGTGCVTSVARQPPGERQPSDARSPSSNVIDLRKVSDDAYVRSYNEAASFGQGACRKATPSHADIDTLDVFPQLNFQVRLSGCDNEANRLAIRALSETKCRLNLNNILFSYFLNSRNTCSGASSGIRRSRSGIRIIKKTLRGHL